MPYPLKIKPQGKYKYFQQREEWKVTDILFNPMVMMMLLPLLLVTVLPKMMQVPQAVEPVHRHLAFLHAREKQAIYE
jgi:hypothetical protein